MIKTFFWNHFCSKKKIVSILWSFARKFNEMFTEMFSASSSSHVTQRCPPSTKVVATTGVVHPIIDRFPLRSTGNGKAVTLPSSGVSSDEWALVWTPSGIPTQPLDGDSIVLPYSQVADDIRQGNPCPNCISGSQQDLWSCVYSWPIVQIIRFGVSGETLRWFSSFPTQRQQCVRVNWSSSNTQCLISGIPKGTVLGPLLFLIFINDLQKSMMNNCSMFADNTTAYTTGKNITTTTVGLSRDVTAASSWADNWGMLFNAEKSEHMTICGRGLKGVGPQPSVSMVGIPIPQVKIHKHLGVIFNDTLTWSKHIDKVYKRFTQRVGILRRLRRTFLSSALRHIYVGAVLPNMDDACPAWSGEPVAKLIHLHKSFCWRNQTSLPPLQKRFDFHTLVLFYKMRNNMTPSYLSSLMPSPSSTSGYQFRREPYPVPAVRKISYNFVTSHTFSRSLSRHKSTINPRFLVINKPSTPLHSGKMQLVVAFQPKQNFERADEQPSGYSVYLPGTESEMACREEPDSLCQDSWVRVALWIKIGEQLLKVLLRNRFCVCCVACTSSSLARCFTKASMVWFAPTKSSPVMVFLVESENRSMQVDLNSNSDSSAWDWRLLARLAVLTAAST